MTAIGRTTAFRGIDAVSLGESRRAGHDIAGHDIAGHDIAGHDIVKIEPVRREGCDFAPSSTIKSAARSASW